MTNMYERVGSLNEAGKVFDEMRHRDIASPGYSVHEEWEKTVEVYGVSFLLVRFRIIPQGMLSSLPIEI